MAVTNIDFFFSRAIAFALTLTFELFNRKCKEINKIRM